jgi:hypothetical protein
MTVATVIYYSGYHPYTLEPVFTAQSKNDKLNQRRYFFWYKPEMRQEITSSLKKNGLQSLEKELFGNNTVAKSKNEKMPNPKHKRKQ